MSQKGSHPQSNSSQSVEDVFLTKVKERESELLTRIGDLNRNLERRQESLSSYKEKLHNIHQKIVSSKRESLSTIDRALGLLEQNIFVDSNSSTQELLSHLKHSVANNYFKMMHDLKERLEENNKKFDISFVRKYFQNITLEYNIGMPADFHRKALRYEEFINREFQKLKDELHESSKKISDLNEKLNDAQEKIEKQTQELNETVNSLTNSTSASVIKTSLTNEEIKEQEDDIDMKLQKIDQKIKETEAKKQGNEGKKEENEQRKLEELNAKKGILNKVKDFFKRKKDGEEEIPEMKLGLDANFKYDPIKKKYIFPGEEEEPEEEFKPPPMKSETVKQVEVQKPVETANAPGNAGGVNSLLQPPSRLPQRKKPGGQATTANPVQNLFVPVLQSGMSLNTALHLESNSNFVSENKSEVKASNIAFKLSREDEILFSDEGQRTWLLPHNPICNSQKESLSSRDPFSEERMKYIEEIRETVKILKKKLEEISLTSLTEPLHEENGAPRGNPSTDDANYLNHVKFDISDFVEEISMSHMPHDSQLNRVITELYLNLHEGDEEALQKNSNHLKTISELSIRLKRRAEDNNSFIELITAKSRRLSELETQYEELWINLQIELKNKAELESVIIMNELKLKNAYEQLQYIKKEFTNCEEEKRSENTKNQAVVDALSKKVKQNEVLIVALKDKLKESFSQEKNVKATLTTILNRNTEQAEIVRDLEAKVWDCEEKEEGLLEQIKELKEQLSEASNYRNITAQYISEIETERNERLKEANLLKKDLERLENEYNNFQTSSEDNSSRLNAKLSDAMEEKETLKQEAKSILENFRASESTNENLKLELAERGQELQAQMAKIETYEQQVVELEQRLEEFERRANELAEYRLRFEKINGDVRAFLTDESLSYLLQIVPSSESGDNSKIEEIGSLAQYTRNIIRLRARLENKVLLDAKDSNSLKSRVAELEHNTKDYLIKINQISHYSKELEGKIAEHVAKIGELTSTQHAITSKLSESEITRTKLLGDISAVSGKLESANLERTNLMTRLEDNAKLITKLTEELKSYKIQTESEVFILKERIAFESVKNQDAEKRLKHLEELNKALIEEGRLYQNSILSVNNKLLEVESERNILLEERTQFSNTLTDERLNSVKSKNEFIESLGLLQKELEATRGELDSTKSDLDFSRRDCDSSKRALESSKRDLDSLRGELEYSRRELETSRKELKAAISGESLAKEETTKQLSELKKLLTNIENESKQDISEWETKYRALEEETKEKFEEQDREVEQKLQVYNEKMTAVINQKDKEISELESEASHLKEKIDKTAKALAEAKEKLEKKDFNDALAKSSLSESEQLLKKKLDDKEKESQAKNEVLEKKLIDEQKLWSVKLEEQLNAKLALEREFIILKEKLEKQAVNPSPISEKQRHKGEQAIGVGTMPELVKGEISKEFIEQLKEENIHLKEVLQQNELLINENNELLEELQRLRALGREQEDKIRALEATNEELRLVNEQLRDNNYLYEQKSSNSDFELLKSMYEKKQKVIDQMKEKEEVLLKKLEELSFNMREADKIKQEKNEIEEHNEQLLKEKRSLLEENSGLIDKLNQNELFQKYNELLIKKKNSEEETKILKENYAEIISNLNLEITELKKIMARENAPQQEVKSQEKTPQIEPTAIEQPKIDNAAASEEKKGFRYTLASFFLTDNDVKTISKTEKK